MAPMALTVVVRSGDAATPPKVTFDSPRIVIGRGEGCDVRLPDPSVSHRHASIRQRGSEYIVVDEGSTNGTFVGPVRLSPQAPRVVRTGDMVRIGRIWLELSIEHVVPTANPGQLDPGDRPRPGRRGLRRPGRARSGGGACRRGTGCRPRARRQRGGPHLRHRSGPGRRLGVGRRGRFTPPRGDLSPRRQLLRSRSRLQERLAPRRHDSSRPTRTRTGRSATDS